MGIKTIKEKKMPKLAILADPHSTHTYKWVHNLSKKGYEILLIGIGDKTTQLYDELKNVQCKCILVRKNQQNRKLDFIKLTNLFHFFKIKKEIRAFSPDILHSFYASSYGLIGALCNVRPYVISIWGSDVFEFPNKSFLHKKILKYSLGKADRLCATGEVLKKESQKYTSKDIDTIPFGIDTDYFKPSTKKNNQPITIGTVKHFKTIYGIETLIQAIAKLKNEKFLSTFKLLLVGDGPEKENYLSLADSLGILDEIEFPGFIMNNQLASYYQQMDVVVIPSLRESFGISVLEGMSCAKPVIASDINGFNEVGSSETITYFEAGNSADLAIKIKSCIENKVSYNEKAKKARERVIELFSEQACVEKKVNLYQQLIGK